MRTLYTGHPCTCRAGVQRDNCPKCEGTGQEIAFQAMRAATQVVLRVNGQNIRSFPTLSEALATVRGKEFNGALGDMLATLTRNREIVAIRTFDGADWIEMKGELRSR